MVGLLSLLSVGHAGVVSVAKQGLAPAWLVVDDEVRGKLEHGQASFELEPGAHTVVIALDARGQKPSCAGRVDVGEEGLTEVVVTDHGCHGLSDVMKGWGLGTGGSVIAVGWDAPRLLGSRAVVPRSSPMEPPPTGSTKGTLRVVRDGMTSVWVSIDGQTADVVSMSPTEEALVPGAHTVLVASDATLHEVLCSGAVNVGRALTTVVTITDDGCLGLGAPAPVVVSGEGTLHASADGAGAWFTIDGKSADLVTKLGQDWKLSAGSHSLIVRNGPTSSSDLFCQGVVVVPASGVAVIDVAGADCIGL